MSALPERVAKEVGEIEAEFADGGAMRIVDLGGERAIIIPVLATDWDPSPLPVLIKIPSLYPDQRPDLIFIPAAAKPAWGTPSRVMGAAQLDGQPWSQISWHMSGAYDPTASNLRAFARSVRLYVSRQV